MNSSRSLQLTLALWLVFQATYTFAAAAPAAAPVLPQGVERVTTVEGITEYRLANGLRVLLFPDASKQTFTVNVTYLVGSRNEGYGETGMAHLLEHMLFRGATHHPTVKQELSQRGAQTNGSTAFDRTNYYETLQASDANFEWAIDMEADRMVNSFIAKKDLDSEMTVVRNEYESGENSPSRVLMQRTLGTAFLWHNYGHLPIGARSDIERVPIERLQAFYHTYYQPDNAVLLVAGKFDEVRALALIQAKFGAIPRPARALQTTYTEEPTQDGERLVTLRRVGDVQVACAAYHVPAGSHAEFPAVDVLAQILGDTPSGRLHKALVETKKASSIGGFAFQLRDPGILFLMAEVPKDKSLDEAREILLKTVESVVTTPPTREEVERARTQLLKEIELSLTSAERVGLALSDWIAMGDWRLLFLYRDRLRKVTPEEVQRVAIAYLKPSNRTAGLFIPTEKPERAEIPPTPDVAAMVKDYKGDAGVSAGESFDPSPANIEARTTRSSVGGLKLALLPKKTRGGMVTAALTLHFGDEKSLMNRAITGRMTGQMLMRGTAHHTRQQLQDEFDRLKARVGVSGDATSARASIETTRENLPAVLKLVAEILREPAFPASEFDQLKQQELAGVEQRKSDPTMVARNALRRHVAPYPKGDVRYTPTPDEEIAEIQAVKLEDLKRFYSDFYGASRGEVAVVGDFDAQAIPGLVGDLLGNWQSRKPYTRIPSLYHNVSALNQSFETPDKANATLFAGLPLQLRDDDPDYPALSLGGYMLGGGFLSSRLATRIREKEGLSYSIGASMVASSLDRVGSFGGGAIYAPQNAARLESAFKEEIARAIKDGFTTEEVTAAQSGYLQERQVGRSQDGAIADQLATYLFVGRTFAWDADFEKHVQSLTPEQISAALRRQIDPDKISIVKAGDFAGAAKKQAQGGK